MCYLPVVRLMWWHFPCYECDIVIVRSVPTSVDKDQRQEEIDCRENQQLVIV